MSARSRLVSALLAGALAAAAGLAFQRVFSWQALAPVVAVAAAVPVLVSLALSGRRRRPLWQAMVLTVAAWPVVVSATLFRGAALAGVLPTPAAASLATAALRDSWKEVLTTVLPAPDRPELLVLAQALVWGAAFAGTELALRTRALLVPAVPAVLVLAAALVFGVDGPGGNLPVVVLVVGLCGLLAVVRHGGPVRSLALALPLVAVLALAAVAIGPALPLVQARPPFDPRNLVAPPPPDPRVGASPLDEVSAWLQQPDTPLFSARSSSAQNWRLAVLDRFDGSTWSASATFVPAGSRMPAPAGGPGAPARDVVDQQVTVQGLPGVWLPTAGRPSTVNGVGVYVDPASGVLVAASPLRPGLRYQAISSVPRFTRAELESAAPAAGAEAAAATALPGAADAGSAVPEPAEMRRYALAGVNGAGTPFQEAVQLADYLRTNYVYDVTAPPGHSYRTDEFFLVTSRRGTSEQFATTFALMARSLGLPSRVVVGFQPGERAGDRWQVHAGDVLVWPEVDFQTIGWVPFFPTPDQGSATAQVQSVAAGETPARQAIDQQIAAASPSPPAAPAPAPRQRARAAGAAPPWLAAPALALPAAVYLLLLLAVPSWRRRRRRRGSPASQVVGAWREVLDQLHGLGLPTRRALSAHDVASFGAAAVGGAADGHLRWLADAVNHAGFAPEPPDPAVADAAWRHSDTVRHMARRTMPLRSRLWRCLGPAALRPGS